MDPEYGTKRRAVPLLVEDVAGSQTSVKVEEIGAKVDKLESIIESTVPRGCLSHWRIVDKTTGELINQGMLDNAINNATYSEGNCTMIQYYTSEYVQGGFHPAIKLIQDEATRSNLVFLIPRVETSAQKVELYNPYDTTVDVFEVTTSTKAITTPIYLKHMLPRPITANSRDYNYYPNGIDVFAISQAVGSEDSKEDEVSVIGLLMSISNKL